LATSGAGALLGGVVALVSLPLALRVAVRGGGGGGGEERVVWGFAHLGLAALAGVAFAGAVAALSPVEAASELTVLLLRGMAVSLGTAAAIGVIAVRVDPGGLSSLGLRSSRSLRAALLALVVWALALPGLWGLGIAWPWLLERLGVAVEPPFLLERIAAARGAPLALAVLLAVVVIPLLEEVCFRGFVQPVLVRRLGGGGGVLLTSVLFAALHGATAFGPVLGLSAVLGAVMLRSRLIAAPFAVHAANNALAILIALAYTGRHPA
jgi:membrane protease YdiL (CAAX protease family)